VKFLIISKPSGPLPEVPAAFFKACQEYLNARLADGTLDCMYVTPDNGGISIMSVDSHEELWEKVSAFPASPLLTHEYYPLLDHNHYYDRIAAASSETESS
jgi:hypothetical protein